MPELLLELFSEEIPARMQAQAAKELERLVVGALVERGLLHQGARAFSGPRRLTLVIDGLPAVQPDLREEKKGPRVGAPQAAIDGFLRSVGLTLDAVEIRPEKKGGESYFAVIDRKGRPTAEVLAEILPGLIRALPWPKSMRWGAHALRWVRPLHAIICVFDGRIVPFAVDHVVSMDAAHGHRFHAPEAFRVRRFADYEAGLRRAFVILDAAERKQLIRESARTAAFAQGFELIEDEALLDEVAGLVEWPVALLGRFDAAFLDLPPEVLRTVMKSHQRYFALRERGTGRFANAFIVIANIEAKDGGAAIIAGNERVLRARLSDAKFFYDADVKVPLAERLPKLREIVFHAKLGTMAEKVERIVDLTRDLARVVRADPEMAEQAARLAKADLVTGMVFEFPELQGVMGADYAEKQGLAPAVVTAIRQHYSPKGPDDACPSEPVAIAVALAEKFDTLLSFWSIDERPTGSKDPFALRRAALGIVRIALENGLRLQLRPYGLRLLDPASPYRLKVRIDDPRSPDESFQDFFADRLKIYLRDRGIRHDLIDAVFALEGQDDLLLITRRVEALQDFLGTEDGASLLAGYRRAANILRIEEKKDGRAYHDAPDPGRFAEAEEHDLATAIGAAGQAAAAALAREDFVAAMRAIAALRGPVDRFFEKVTVNAPEAALRANRLRLLAQIRTALHAIADISRIEG